MKFQIDEADIKASKIPHEVFLTNLIVNHILYFVSALGIAKSIPQLVMVTPIASIAALSYIMIRGNKMVSEAPWFVQCHWRIAMKRSKLLMAMLLGLIALLSTLYAIHVFGGAAFATIFPLAAVVTLPVMVTIFALIIMESDALHQAKSGQISNSMAERFPPPADLIPLEEA
jgi:hypothetical protein